MLVVFATILASTNAEGKALATSATSGKRFQAERIRTFPQGSRHFDGSVERGTPLRPVALQCPRVAVVTTISPPGDAIFRMMRAPEWCTVVVGDAKTPGDAYAKVLDPKRHVYLSVEEQNGLGFKLASQTPINHFSRKNVGYLYAVRMGAKRIFDFDDDNSLLQRSLPNFTTFGPMPAHVLRPRNRTANQFDVLNPCTVGFDADSMWPRGFPLSRINTRSHTKWLVETMPVELGVIQSMANNDPDVDAIYRLAPRASQPLPFVFRNTKQPQVLGANVYAPFNAQASVFTERAMWAMYLPTTVHGRVSDIWRSYVAQRLFWTVGLRLAFHKPWVAQFRNSHDYLSDFMSERPLYETTEELIRVLQAWVPAPHSTLAHNFEDLYVTLYEYGFVEIGDVTGVQLWLEDLLAMEYLDIATGGLPTPAVPPTVVPLMPATELQQNVRNVLAANLSACSASPSMVASSTVPGIDPKVAQWIAAHQEPTNCSFISTDHSSSHLMAAKFKDVPPGMGAAIFFSAKALAHGAISQSFRVIDTLKSVPYANERLCPAQDLSCYMTPLSTCKDDITTVPRNQPKGFFTVSDTYRKLPTNGLESTPPVIAAGVAHIMRPNPSMRAYIRKMRDQIGLSRLKYISLQLRTGGRFMADGRKFPSVREYATWTVLAAAHIGVKAVYVTTDLYDILAEYSGYVNAHGISVHYIPESAFRTDDWPKHALVENARERLYDEAPPTFDYPKTIFADWFLAAQRRVIKCKPCKPQRHSMPCETCLLTRVFPH